MSTDNNNKLDFIDSLRGIAALYVFLYHFAAHVLAPATPPELIRSLVMYGGSGVALFFIISAFTLCMSAESRRLEANPLFNFYTRRFFRIAPLFYVWIALTCIRDIIAYGAVHSPLEFAASTFFAFNFIPGMEEGFVWASWTLGVEMIFYALFPLAFRMTRTLGAALIALALSMLVSWGWQQAALQWLGTDYPAHRFATIGFLHQLPQFMMGIVVYRAYRAMPQPQGAARVVVALACVGLSAAYFIGLTHRAFRLSETLKFDGTMAAYALLILGLSLVPFRLFVNRGTRFLGKISYSVYLSHATIIFLLTPVTAWIYKNLGGAAFIIATAIALACICAFSMLTYRFVESPGNRLGRIIIEKRSANLPLYRMRRART